VVPERDDLVDVRDDEDVGSFLLEPLRVDQHLHGGDGKASQSRADPRIVAETIRDIADPSRRRLRGREARHGLAEGELRLGARVGGERDGERERVGRRDPAAGQGGRPHRPATRPQGREQRRRGDHQDGHERQEVAREDALRGREEEEINEGEREQRRLADRRAAREPDDARQRERIERDAERGRQEDDELVDDRRAADAAHRRQPPGVVPHLVRDEAEEREALAQDVEVGDPVRIGGAEARERPRRGDGAEPEPAADAGGVAAAERRDEAVEAEHRGRRGGERPGILRPGGEADQDADGERAPEGRARVQVERRLQREDDEERQQYVRRDDAALDDVRGEHRHEEAGHEPRRRAGDGRAERRHGAHRRDRSRDHHEPAEDHPIGQRELVGAHAARARHDGVRRRQHVHAERRVGREAGVQLARRGDLDGGTEEDGLVGEVVVGEAPGQVREAEARAEDEDGSEERERHAGPGSPHRAGRRRYEFAGPLAS